MKQRWVLTGLVLVTLATLGGLAALKPGSEPAPPETSGTLTSPTPETDAPASVTGRSTGATNGGISVTPGQRFETVLLHPGIFHN